MFLEKIVIFLKVNEKFNGEARPKILLSCKRLKTVPRGMGQHKSKYKRNYKKRSKLTLTLSRDV